VQVGALELEDGNLIEVNGKDLGEFLSHALGILGREALRFAFGRKLGKGNNGSSHAELLQ
jgi:hypothetical protein